MKKILAILPVLILVLTVPADAAVRKVYYSGRRTVTTGSTYNDYFDAYIKNALKNYYQKQNTQTAVETTTETTTEKQTVQKTTASQTVSANSSVPSRILDLVNRERAANGLKALTLDTSLSYVAQAKAEDMQQRGYFSHTSPTYGSPFDMMRSFGISYRSAGENIAKGQKTPEAVMTAWMNSSGHRKNILGSSYTKLGVGYVNKNGTTYWVQMFIG